MSLSELESEQARNGSDDADIYRNSLGEGQNMKVTAADFSYKQQKEAPSGQQNAKSNARDKQKIIKKTQKLNRYVNGKKR